ncbi:hypothetical protein LWI29_031698 [Acer saccharum]|uniref:Photolyase/cryptochrome alpha/beta domain-containing protein n=1 Tax=Acer saccharum TaxID=4024 RepID=A0AA39VYQ9_ACESA|nr:hypothetical protein LWI29_031698 [Acer saccharum]
MAVVGFPGSLSLPSAPNRRTFRGAGRRNNCICCARSGSAILWFKQDLRVDDHFGLVAASKYQSLVPLYVFDHRILSRYSDEMLELVLFALEDLRKSLKEQGSDLMIRFGRVENVIRELVKEVRATSIFAEEEVEYHLRKMISNVDESLATVPSIDWKLEIFQWRTPFYDIKNLNHLPASYNDFTKLQLPPTSPIVSPTLPCARIELNWGDLPTFDELKEFMNKNPWKSKESWTVIKKMSAERILLEKLSQLGKRIKKNLDIEHAPEKRADKSVFFIRKGNIVGGGTNSVLNALAAYLRYLEGTARSDWQEVHERLRNAESRDGASFFALFGPAVCLGIVSRRRVHYEAIKYEKERNAGFLSPFGYSATTVAAAADAVCSMEWYWLMALRSLTSNERKYSTRIWRWNGYLIQYTVVGHEGPAILLVHGFGAFFEHYRDNISDIANSGNRVWAITVLGFGKSEKPNIVYTELMWAQLLRDFIVEVVGEPVHLAGNSIGGYFVAIVASLWPALVKSLVLINSAGNVIPEKSFIPFSNERQTSRAAWLGARLLLFFLRSNLKNTVKQCYPTRMERADDWLISEMLRASHDPGVLVVLESIFSFNLSIPLNYLLEGFEEKILIIQGMKDPISDSKSKLAMLKEYCSGVVIKELDAGHCPHDERPEEVNSIIQKWIATVEIDPLFFYIPVINDEKKCITVDRNLAIIGSVLLRSFCDFWYLIGVTIPQWGRCPNCFRRNRFLTWNCLLVFSNLPLPQGMVISLLIPQKSTLGILSAAAIIFFQSQLRTYVIASHLNGFVNYLEKGRLFYLVYPWTAYVKEFGWWSEAMVDELCDCVKPVSYTEHTHIVMEGDKIDEILFLVQGKVRTYLFRNVKTGSAAGSSRHRTVINHLRDSDRFFGEELVAWFQADPYSSDLPISNKTVSVLTEAVGFALMSADLKSILIKNHAALFLQLFWRFKTMKKHQAAQKQTPPSHQPQQMAFEISIQES